MHASAPTATPIPLLQHVRSAYAQAQADLYRACTLCDHGPRRSGHHDLCALGGQPRLRVHVARSADGPCGPEAKHMRIDGWDLAA
jgi:hypothetical protein